MPASASPALTIPRTYADLRRAVETAFFAGQRAAERATIHASWLIGRLIHEHVMLFEHRADYGARTIRRLAADVKISDCGLYRCWDGISPCCRRNPQWRKRSSKRSRIFPRISD